MPAAPAKAGLRPGAWRGLRPAALAVVLAGAAWAVPAHAGLFDDDEARRAILDLRTKQEQADQRAQDREKELADQIAALQRGVLELNTQLDMLRNELARMRGNNEELARAVADLQRKQKDTIAPIEERLRKIEPVKVTLDGRDFMASPEEKDLYESSVAPIKSGNFDGAIDALQGFQKRYPASGYHEAVTYWLGNAYYGKRDYKQAIASFKSLIADSPDHPKVPEAMLAVANCQIELKDIKVARRTLGELIKKYPQSEAAAAARERLAALR